MLRSNKEFSSQALEGMKMKEATRKVPVYAVEDIMAVMEAEVELNARIRYALRSGASPGDGSYHDRKAREAQANLNALRQRAFNNSRANAVERPLETFGTSLAEEVV
jgi:hypothetical protein